MFDDLSVFVANNETLPFIPRTANTKLLNYVEYSTFNAGERHFKVVLDEFVDEVVINVRAYVDPFQLALLISALSYHPKVGLITLRMPYLPYGRQDRICSEGEAFSLEVFLFTISDVDKLIVTDCHSPDITKQLCENVGIELVDNYSDIIEALSTLDTFGFTAVIAPDKGAYKRAKLVANKLNVPVYACTKVREADGIIRIKTDQLLDVSEKYLVVDDICDGGGTFIALAKALNLPNLSLLVTHGIFANDAVSKLKNYYSNVISIY